MKKDIYHYLINNGIIIDKNKVVDKTNCEELVLLAIKLAIVKNDPTVFDKSYKEKSKFYYVVNSFFRLLEDETFSLLYGKEFVNILEAYKNKVKDNIESDKLLVLSELICDANYLKEDLSPIVVKTLENLFTQKEMFLRGPRNANTPKDYEKVLETDIMIFILYFCSSNGEEIYDRDILKSARFHLNSVKSYNKEIVENKPFTNRNYKTPEKRFRTIFKG